MNWDIIREKLDEYHSFDAIQLQSIDNTLRIELVHTENLLDNNSLNRNDTAIAIEKGLTVGGKPIIDHIETINHAEAYDWVTTQANRTPDSLILRDILYINLLVSKGIEINAGRLRSETVQAPNSHYSMPTPTKVPQLIESLLSWLHVNTSCHPIALAAEAHYRLISIHPFKYRNGRTARLLMNMILHMHDYPAAIIRQYHHADYLAAVKKVQNTGNIEDINIEIISDAIEHSLDIRLQNLEQNQISDTNSNNNPLIKIGTLAKAVGEANSTIRYWMKSDLIEAAQVLESGYQLFNQNAIARAKGIQDLKSQRFTLSEIKNILGQE